MINVVLFLLFGSLFILVWVLIICGKLHAEKLEMEIYEMRKKEELEKDVMREFNIFRDAMELGK